MEEHMFEEQIHNPAIQTKEFLILQWNLSFGTPLFKGNLPVVPSVP